MFDLMDLNQTAVAEIAQEGLTATAGTAPKLATVSIAAIDESNLKQKTTLIIF